jgi:hypothetical protein
MERSTNDELKGDKFVCSCGNTNFEQECYVKSIEIVNVIKDENEKLTIVSKEMQEVLAENIEYTNEVRCPKCQAHYTVGRQDGKDIICQTGVGEDE